MFRQVLLAVVFVSVCRACTYNPNCKSTYIMDVANGDACSAANAFQSCVSAMLAGCTSEQAAQPNFSEDVTAASTAILSHCAPPPPPPGGGGLPPPPNTNDGAPPPPPNTNEGGTPAPPPPPQPTAPQQSTDCQLNVACESTYVTAVSSGDACGAATTFVNCASTNADQCGDNIPSTVEAALNYARQQKAEKCNEPPAPGVPACAQICIQYKDAAELLIAQGNTSYACSKLTQYSTCLQNQHSSCDTTVARQEAESLLAVCAGR